MTSPNYLHRDIDYEISTKDEGDKVTYEVQVAAEKLYSSSCPDKIKYVQLRFADKYGDLPV